MLMIEGRLYGNVILLLDILNSEYGWGESNV